MIPTSLRIPLIIVILLATFAAKSTRAFTPTVILREQTSGAGAAIVSTRQKPVRTTVQRKIIRLTRMSLNGTPNRHRDSPSSSSSKKDTASDSGRDGILSSTARESAVIAEWEPILELQRHIEEGGFGRSHGYGSDGERGRGGGEIGQDHDWVEETDGIQVVDGVFCGYRFTKEECIRLRSANPT